MRVISIAAVTFIALSFPVLSADTVRLGSPGNAEALVWRNHEAYKEAVALIRAGAEEMVLKLLACTPARGTKAAIVERGAFSHTIIVIEGPDKGCKGFVAVEETRG